MTSSELFSLLLLSFLSLIKVISWFVPKAIAPSNTAVKLGTGDKKNKLRRVVLDV